MRLLRSSSATDQSDIDLRVTREGTTAIVAVSGELDLASVPQLRSCLTDLIGRGEHRMVVDLSGVTFCDSTALGVFVGAHRRVTSGGGKVEFRDPPATPPNSRRSVPGTWADRCP